MKAARYDPARQAEYDRRSRERHHAERLAKERADREARREYHREKSRQHYARHREAILERAREVHAEARRAAVRRWRARNIEEVRRRERAWSKANPVKVAAKRAARRARILGAEGSHTIEEWHAVCEEFGGLCAYCGEEKPLTRDHVVPLVRGGSHYIDNIVPACLSCNSSKGARTAEEFLSAQEKAA